MIILVSFLTCVYLMSGIVLDCLDLANERSTKYCTQCGYVNRDFLGFIFGHSLRIEWSTDGPRKQGLLLIAFHGSIDHFSRVDIEVRFLIAWT